MKLIVPFVITAVTAFGVTAQNTQKLTATKATDYGLIYTLPSTVIDVTIEAERTVETPGEFYKYARKYLDIDPVTETSESWQLLSVTLTAKTVADDNNRYSVQFKSGSAPFMLINENNTPVSVNDESYNPSYGEAELPEARKAQPTILELPEARQAMTEDMLQSKSTAKRAELAAAKIYELRQNRNDIIAGQADAMPTDGAAMKLALDNISRQEEALTAMFVGTKSTSTQVRTFTFVPGEESERIVIARLSMLDGIVDADDLSGDPIYLNYVVTAKGELPLTDKGEPRKFPKGGLAYRIPGTADVSIMFDGGKIQSQVFKIAQLGVVYGLDPGIFTDKKAPAYVRFDPLTGGIVETGTKD